MPAPRPSDPTVDAIFREMPHAYAEIAGVLRATIARAASSLRETVKWNTPFWVGRGNVLCVPCFPDHVNLGVMRGAELARDLPEIEGAGKSMRHVTIQSVPSARSDRVKKIIRAAVRRDASE